MKRRSADFVERWAQYQRHLINKQLLETRRIQWLTGKKTKNTKKSWPCRWKPMSDTTPKTIVYSLVHCLERGNVWRTTFNTEQFVRPPSMVHRLVGRSCTKLSKTRPSTWNGRAVTPPFNMVVEKERLATTYRLKHLQLLKRTKIKIILADGRKHHNQALKNKHNACKMDIILNKYSWLEWYIHTLVNWHRQSDLFIHSWRSVSRR